MVCVIIVVNIKLMNTASFDITVWSKSPNEEGYTYNDVLTQNIISKCNFDLRRGGQYFPYRWNHCLLLCY